MEFSYTPRGRVKGFLNNQPVTASDYLPVRTSWVGFRITDNEDMQENVAEWGAGVTERTNPVLPAQIGPTMLVGSHQL